MEPPVFCKADRFSVPLVPGLFTQDYALSLIDSTTGHCNSNDKHSISLCFAFLATVHQITVLDFVVQHDYALPHLLPETSLHFEHTVVSLWCLLWCPIPLYTFIVRVHIEQ